MPIRYLPYDSLTDGLSFAQSIIGRCDRVSRRRAWIPYGYDMLMRGLETS